METIKYTPVNVCSRQFEISYEDGIIKHVKIVGGCPGNLLGISKLLEGMEIQKAISIMSGIKCPGSRTRQTSCPDQISLALKSIN